MERPDLPALCAVEIAERVREGRTSAAEIADAHLAGAADPQLVLAAAAAIDSRADRFALPLAGVPVAVAAELGVAGSPTAAGPPATRDGAAVRALRAAGAVVLGAAPTVRLGELVAGRSAVLALTVDQDGSVGGVAAAHGIVGLTTGGPEPAQLGRTVADVALLRSVLQDGPLAEAALPDRIALSLRHPPPWRAVHPDHQAAARGAAARLRAGPGGAGVVLDDPPYPLLVSARRTEWRQRMLAWFAAAGCDLLICPTPARHRPGAALTRVWSLAGLPTAVAPVLVAGQRVGVQLVGLPGTGDALLAAAARLEQRVVPMAGAAPRRVYL